jgi:hypothetical protein
MWCVSGFVARSKSRFSCPLRILYVSATRRFSNHNKRTSRIKKESSIEAYWKRISMYYHDVVGHAMGNNVLKDIRNVCCCSMPFVIELTAGEVDTKSRIGQI